MKYISIKILPKGRIPPNNMIDKGCIRHLLCGISLAIALTRHGTLFNDPEVCLPNKDPINVNGNMTKIQMAPIANIVVNGMARLA